ncbi:hypothetical protein HYPSUDRAFT_204854 [Hypholoma sublateritium FD-334 SS-4]|uniref:Lytic polysaccharide monooxygenase n=1 Tax=Hypholoma sublateritium (strain FD-334 SS-4) TaxID=945553 RepID=A0A0D2NJP7_HYPSF|nr:hypothetical protein HYPSUDRAFT_204854 [Hypholoma sublateritium FD-334 SS-4]
MRAATLLGAAVWMGAVNAHLAAWHKGMYCLNGNTGSTDLNSYAIVSPIYQQPFSGWWMHGFNNCNQYPPADGDFLDLPAGGSFSVEIASNRAKTTLSYNGQYTSEWPDGSTYPEDYNVPTCITSPNMHTQNQSQAAGTAFAISYESDINNVTPDNLAVFSVRYNTPWKREIQYDVPAAMPACPAAGCICAWGWVPNGCGQPNIYQTPFRCRVTGATSTTPVAAPKPPVWCEGNSGACTKGAKQMIYWNQNERNNIVVSGLDQVGEPKSPAYNSKLGFPDGAQEDIFTGAASSGGSSSSGSPASVVSSAAAAAKSTAAAAAAAVASSISKASSSAPTISTTTASSNSTSTTSTTSSPGRQRKCSAGRTKRSVTANTELTALHADIAGHKRRHARRAF